MSVGVSRNATAVIGAASASWREPVLNASNWRKMYVGDRPPPEAAGRDER